MLGETQTRCARLCSKLSLPTLVSGAILVFLIIYYEWNIPVVVVILVWLSALTMLRIGSRKKSNNYQRNHEEEYH